MPKVRMDINMYIVDIYVCMYIHLVVWMCVRVCVCLYGGLCGDKTSNKIPKQTINLLVIFILIDGWEVNARL